MKSTIINLAAVFFFSIFAEAATISGPLTSANPGSQITATWSGITSPTNKDWIGMFAAGAGNGSYINWVYVSCSRTPSIPIVNGNCPFVAPAQNGNYEFRLFTNDTFNVLAFGTFTVGIGGSPPPPPPPPPPPTTGTYFSRLLLGDCPTLSVNATLYLCYDGNTIDGVSPRGIVLDVIDATQHSGHMTFRRALGSRSFPQAVGDGTGLGALYFEGFDGSGYVPAGYILLKSDGFAIPGKLGSALAFAMRDMNGGVFVGLNIRGRAGLHTSLESPYQFQINAPSFALPRHAPAVRTPLCIEAVTGVINPC